MNLLPVTLDAGTSSDYTKLLHPDIELDGLLTYFPGASGHNYFDVPLPHLQQINQFKVILWEIMPFCMEILFMDSLALILRAQKAIIKIIMLYLIQ